MSIKSDRARAKARHIDMEMWAWLSGGLERNDLRLALFDSFGEPVDRGVIKQAIEKGFAEPWFSSPMRPQWTICRLTRKGFDAVSHHDATTR